MARHLRLALACFAGAVVCLLASWALAQSPVSTYPLGAATTNVSTTITLTNNFQSVFAQSSTRRSCVIQNTGVNTMWVYFGAIAGATKAKSFPLAPASSAGSPGGFVSCNNGSTVVTDQVSITGTTGDTFTATSQ